jgi:hypothetical protein
MYVNTTVSMSGLIAPVQYEGLTVSVDVRKEMAVTPLIEQNSTVRFIVDKQLSEE